MRPLLLVLLLSISVASIVERAREALGSSSPELRLTAANTPLDADLEGDWSMETRVVAGLEADTPRVEVCARQGRRERRWTVAFRKAVEVECLVLSRPLRRGDFPEGLRTQREQLRPGQTWLPPGASLAGMRLRRPLPAGSPLRLEDLEPVPLVDSGSHVSVVSRSQGVILHIEARCLEDGFANKPFRVRTSDGRVLTVCIGPDHQVSERIELP